jgi:hypothetical protein
MVDSPITKIELIKKTKLFYFILVFANIVSLKNLPAFLQGNSYLNSPTNFPIVSVVVEKFLSGRYFSTRSLRLCQFLIDRFALFQLCLGLTEQVMVEHICNGQEFTQMVQDDSGCLNFTIQIFFSPIQPLRF